MLPSRMFFDNFLDDVNVDERMMKCDIYEKDGIFHVEADVPGFNKDDINIEFNKGNLVISAEKHVSEKDYEDVKYIRRERSSYQKYQRSFYLGEVDEDGINATFNDGILKISIPKKHEESTKRIIEIK